MTAKKTPKVTKKFFVTTDEFFVTKPGPTVGSFNIEGRVVEAGNPTEAAEKAFAEWEMDYGVYLEVIDLSTVVGIDVTEDPKFIFKPIA